jgi:protein-disulfide isomerase
MNKGSAFIAIAVAFVFGLAIGHLATKGSGGGEVAQQELDSKARGAAKEAASGVERFKVPVNPDVQPTKGAEPALVTIVEFSEFQCPFCKKAKPTVDRILKEYGDKVRFVWRNNPLPMHDNAPMAAQAAMEAYDQGGNEKFWKMHEILFKNQKALSRSDLESYAKQVGLNMQEFKTALDKSEHQKAVKADQALARKLGARGTPAFFINGRKLMGAQPFNKFKSVIEDEIGRAEKMLGAGVPKGQLYSEFIKNAKTSPSDDKDKGKGKNKKRKKKKRPDPNAVYKVPVQDEPQKGPNNALVTIVEFSDFQCPFCKRVNSTVDKVVEEYGNDVRVLWKNNPLPFHDQAMPAAIAAMEVHEQAGDRKFWKYHDKLFQNQKSLSRSNLEKFAKELGGINMAQFKRALDNEEHKDEIKKEQKLARSLGATGTPAFFINGRNIRGAQPFPKFKSVIEEELKRAKKIAKNGTPRSKVYAKAIEDGATEQQFIEPKGGGAAKGKGRGNKGKNKVYDIPVPDDLPSKGSPNADVVIQEFSDFQCPFCKRVLPTVDRVLKEYGDKVKVVWRNYPLPFHDQAMPAAQAALEVYEQGGNAKFWKYHDKLFENQKSLSRKNLEKFAKELGGINMAQFRKALDNNEHKSKIKADKQAVSKAGARIGTPSFFINGRLVQGARPFSAFKSKIEKALEEN